MSMFEQTIADAGVLCQSVELHMNAAESRIGSSYLGFLPSHAESFARTDQGNPSKHPDSILLETH